LSGIAGGEVASEKKEGGRVNIDAEAPLGIVWKEVVSENDGEERVVRMDAEVSLERPGSAVCLLEVKSKSSRVIIAFLT
jgi:hypothetical protein